MRAAHGMVLAGLTVALVAGPLSASASFSLARLDAYGSSLAPADFLVSYEGAACGTLSVTEEYAVPSPEFVSLQVYERPACLRLDFTGNCAGTTAFVEVTGPLVSLDGSFGGAAVNQGDACSAGLIEGVVAIAGTMTDPDGRVFDVSLAGPLHIVTNI
jgi:hypothetical protein